MAGRDEISGAKMTAPPRPAYRRTDGLVALPVTLLFAVVTAAALRSHEVGWEEAQAWLVAIHSQTFAALLHNMSYEGSPPLWPLLLRLVGFVSRSPEAMQWLNWGLATAWVGTFTLVSPFSRWTRALFPFGYYALYEYGTLSRSCALSLLLLTLACAFHRDRATKPIRLAVVLALAALTSVHALIIVIAFGAAIFAEHLQLDAAARKRFRPRPSLPVPLLGAAAGALASLVCLKSANDYVAPGGPGREWFLNWDFDRAHAVLAAFPKSLLPAPIPGLNFWNSHYIDAAIPSGVFLSAVALALLFGLARTLRRDPPALVFFGFATAGLLGFLYVRQIGLGTQQGHFYFVGLLAVWLVRSAQPTLDLDDARKQLWTRGHRALQIGQLLVAAYAVRMDLIHPFAAGKEAARFLESKGLSYLVAADWDIHGAVVAAFLERPLYYPRINKVGTFLQLNADRHSHFQAPDTEICVRARERAKEQDRQLILLLGYVPSPQATGTCSLHRIASFTSAITGESLFVFDTSGSDAKAAVAAAPKAPVAPVPGLKVIEPGTEPRVSRSYSFGDDLSERRVLTVQASTTREGSPTQTSPALAVAVEFSAKSAQPTLAIVEMKILDVGLDDAARIDPRIAKEVAQAFSMFRGVTATIEISSQGDVRAVTLPPVQGVQSPAAIEFLDAIRQAAEGIVPPLPTEPIGVGAKWERRGQLVNGAIEQSTKSSFELTALAPDGETTITATIERRIPTRSAPDPRMPPGTTVEVTSRGTYTFTVPFDRLSTAVTGDVESTLRIEVPAAGATARQSRVEQHKLLYEVAK